MMDFFRRYFTRENPLSHYIHHFLVANIGLYVAYMIFGSITIWEVILFLFMAYTPLIDEFLYVILHYLDDEACRAITNFFMAGEYAKSFVGLHQKRMRFTRLVLHNFLVYFALLSLLYVFLMLDMSLGFYGLAGLLVHLMQDIANDRMEFKSFTHWLWPVNFLLNHRS